MWHVYSINHEVYMKISYKILLPLFIVIVMTFSILTYLLTAFNEQTSLLKGFYAHNLKNLEMIVSIDAHFSSSYASIPELIIANMMGTQKESIKKQAEVYLHQIEKCLLDLKTINKSQYSQKEKQLIQTITQALIDYIPFYKQIAEICITGDSYTASEKYPRLEKKGMYIKNKLKDLISMESYLTKHAIQDTIQKATHNSDTIKVIIKVGGFASLFLCA
ncbi:MAG: Methyl-accepting chemotaxis protein [Candidatus Magnetoglobus multicellularis str. Araruama]|uniref:Methyl-accepting chemotaxis protein n=1 Tax=Candidatus Magnetoglobus multicellularis str. Araruama TaxID=890399 RepID=A0A1V1PAE6_9BACT|nr:MAG: Methyl-accepting chemotaxis protein [Candidatus Magnetoglobus multicellularis str. Araruama]